MADRVLDGKALNRATLARQMLLDRAAVTPLKAVERLVGLQGQEAKPPYVGMWSRVAGFQREQLTRLIQGRKVVRATALRATLHLVTARDFLWLRPTLQPALTQAFESVLRKQAEGLDMKRVVARARGFFAKGQAPFDALRAHLAELDGKIDARVMGYAVRTHLPLVQVPDDSPWGYPNKADFALADAWLDKPMEDDAQVQTLVKRYLAAFGPASVADARTWSGMKGLEAVFDALRKKLRVFHDERGRELFDVPRAPQPPANTAAPVRFLPEYDNLVLSHADRTRIVPDAHRGRIVTKNLRVRATFLMDGMVAGTWRMERNKHAATLIVEPFEKVSTKARAELKTEGGALVQFAEPDATTFRVDCRKAS